MTRLILTAVILLTLWTPAPASDEVTVKREALALFVGFYFDGKGLDVHRAVKLGDITRAGESLRAALDERKEA